MTHFHGINPALQNFQDDLLDNILRNDVPDSEGECPRLSPQALVRAQKVLEITGCVSQLIISLNKLYGHDHGDETFILAHDEEIARLKLVLGVKA